MGWFWADAEKPKNTPPKPLVQNNNDGPPPQCPMHNKNNIVTNNINNNNNSNSAPVCPMRKSREDLQDKNFNYLTNMPMDISPTERAPGQKEYLPTDRMISSIPRGSSENEGLWEYPSPQQMYNAILRKGGTPDNTPEDAIESMVDVHNFLNEGAWQEICKWEKKYTEMSHKSPRLIKFEGKSSDLSPRARWYQLLSNIGLTHTEPPFDRHDWTVLRFLPNDSTPELDSNTNTNTITNKNSNSSYKSEQVRYIIDYYSEPDNNNSSKPSSSDDDTPVFFLDVRPALDSVTAATDRVSVFWHKAIGASLDGFPPYKPAFPFLNEIDTQNLQNSQNSSKQ